MRFLVKLFPEITIKSRPVRQRLLRQLRRNIRTLLRQVEPAVEVQGEWDALEVLLPDDSPDRGDGNRSPLEGEQAKQGRQPEVERWGEAASIKAQLLDRLACIPGIDSVLEVDRHPLPDMDGILKLALTYHAPALKGKTFAVRCKRSGQHPFRSVDVERHVGAGLLRDCDTAGVNLSQPEVTVALEIRDQNLYIVRARHPGLGGFPLGTQDSVLSLVSGGFDSAVSSYLCMRRGLCTHYCFFNLGGRAHELAVKELALYLWLKFHGSHRVRFISVPFEGVVAEILRAVEASQRGVMLKRMMLRAADRLARRLDIAALVTGESVAQVSSQTLANLACIDRVSETMVLRPLVASDKQEIIDLARRIGTETFSRQIPEYCGVISQRPTTRAKESVLARQEAGFDFQVLEQAVAAAREELITELGGVGEEKPPLPPVPVVHEAAAGSVVVDIRHPTEAELKPLAAATTASAVKVETLNIPFYDLHSQKADLDPAKRYLLYCERGMMSRLHAAHLWDEGHRNIAVFQPHGVKKPRAAEPKEQETKAQESKAQETKGQGAKAEKVRRAEQTV